MPQNYVENSTISGLPIRARTIHALLISGTEILSRALSIGKEAGIDPGFIAELQAAVALSSAARHMLICLHINRRLTESTDVSLEVGRAEQRL